MTFEQSVSLSEERMRSAVEFSTLDEALARLGKETIPPESPEKARMKKRLFLFRAVFALFMFTGFYALFVYHNPGAVLMIIFLTVCIRIIRSQDIRQRGMERHVWKTTVRSIRPSEDGAGKTYCADLIFPDGHIESDVRCHFDTPPGFGDRLYVTVISCNAGIMVSIQSDAVFEMRDTRI